jgi:hypothetical protein
MMCAHERGHTLPFTERRPLRLRLRLWLRLWLRLLRGASRLSQR